MSDLAVFTAIMYSWCSCIDSLHYILCDYSPQSYDTGAMIVNNTTMVTTQALANVQLCQYYTANVTAFSSEY